MAHEIIQYSSRLDAPNARLIVKNLSPDRVGFLIDSADNGDISSILLLHNEQMKQAWYQSVIRKRCGTVTALEWEIVSQSALKPDSTRIDMNLADQMAVFIEEEIDSLPSFEPSLNHWARSIPTGISCSELVYEGTKIKEIVNVPDTRLYMKLWESNVLRILTDSEPVFGIPTSDDPMKWLIHFPDPKSGPYPFIESISRANLPIWLITVLNLSTWSTFCERFGMPIVVANIEQGADDATVKAVQDMLATLGSAGYATFKGVDTSITPIEVNRQAHPYGDILQAMQTIQSVLVLGANLGTDMSGGSFAAARVQDNVRQDILNNDIKGEQNTVQELFRRMCQLRFPQFDADVIRMHCPIFRRILLENRDDATENLAWSKVQWGIEHGYVPDDAEVFDMLGLTMPQGFVKTDPDSDPDPEAIENENELDG